MSEYNLKLKSFYERFGAAKEMVLATSKNNRVTARMMSCVIIDGYIYLQTDKKLLKYEQIIANPSVALCTSNVQIEGKAAVLGHPLDEKNSFFVDAYEQSYKRSMDFYSSIPDEVLIKICPNKITLWEYENSKPYRVFFDIENKKYLKEFYVG